MTSTLGVWMLTGYGAEKAPHLMQLSVHCDHLRSISFRRADPFTLRRKVTALTTLLQKRCAPQYTATREDETFMVCQLFSPYGETWAVLTSVFQTFSSLSAIRRNTDRFERVFPAIRRKTCCFDQVFSQNFFLLPPPYGETHALLLTCFPEKICFPDIRPRERGKLNHFSKKD